MNQETTKVEFDLPNLDKLIDTILDITWHTLDLSSTEQELLDHDRLQESLRVSLTEYSRTHVVQYRKLEKRRDIAERLANTDALTGLANRRALDLALPAAEADPNLAIIRFDLNNFGRVNKSHYDEPGGDAVLGVLAERIDHAARMYGTNRIFRRGGDEFVVIAPHEVADKIVSEADAQIEALLHSGKTFTGRDGQVYDWNEIRKLGVGLAGATSQTFSSGAHDLATHKKQQKRKRLLRKLRRPFST